MSIIKVQKINEVWMRVTAETGIEHELSDHFCYFMDGYKFSPKYKAGIWDGKLRLYNLGRKTLYVGLFDQLVKFADREDYIIEVIDSKEHGSLGKKNGLNKNDVDTWVRNLEHTSKGEEVTVYDHQLEAIYTALNEERCTLVSPTSSGKSLMIYSLIRRYLEEDLKVLLIVPTTQLCEQMYSDFEDYSSISNWRTEDHCQRLYSGFSKVFSKSVLISTWQSLIKQPPEYVEQFDCVICDEVHLASGASITKILESMPNARYRVGLTGTLSDAKANRMQICGLFGRQVDVITTKELMDLGRVVELDIRCLLVRHSEEDSKLTRKAKYADELEFVVGLPKRNEFIANLAMATKGNTLILVTWIDKHLIPLEEAIRRKAGDRKVVVIHGGVDPKEREEIRKTLNDESDTIAICSFATMSTGVNVPSIENIILASSSKSKIRNLQSIGRGLRLKEGKTKCKLFDIADNLTINKHENHLFKHFKVRLDQYQKEKFNYKITEVKL